MEWIVTGIAYGVDSLKYFEGAWHLLIAAGSAAWTVLGGAATLGVALIAASVNGLLEFFGFSRSKMLDEAAQDLAKFTEVMNQQTSDEWNKAMAAFEQPSAVDAVKQRFDGIKNSIDEAAQATKDAVKPTQVLSDEFLKLGEDIQKLTSDWQLQADTFGMSAREAEIFKLAQQGATDEQLKSLKDLNELLTANEKKQKLMDEGKSLTESLRTPLEKYQEEMKHLEELLASGAIDQTTFDRAVAKAKGDVGGEVKLAGVATAGSTEALSTIARATNLGKNDPMSTLNKTNEEQLATLKSIDRSLRTQRQEAELELAA